tara:strand:- start:1003 stop:1932 length:930 start_codon:yes stop_codon:yes gene_type:complete
MSEEKNKVENVEEGTVVELEAETTEESTTENETVEAEAVEESTEAESSEESEEELEQYSDRVQKRISTLTRRLREAERASESAYTYATQLQEANKKLEEKSSSLDQSYLNEAENRLKSQKAQAEAALKAAYQDQDFDKVGKAQSIIAKIAVEESKIESSKSQLEYQNEQKSQNAETVEQPVAQAPVPQPVPEPDEKATAWAQKNEWFGSDEILTNAAFTIHGQLVNDEGFDPKSDEYYTEIDNRLRKRFPNDFSVEEKNKKPTQRVASAGRADASAKPSKKQVRLSPSEVQMAKKLNVPLNEYAKFVKR